MGHYLNFGAGPNQLAEPWQNLNAGHDIRKALRFDDESVSRILAEHVIEHVPFMAGFGFLRECHRVLEPGGVLRLAFPDASRFILQDGSQLLFSMRGLQYAQALEAQEQGGLIRAVQGDDQKTRAALVMLFAGWGHQAAWSEPIAAGVLLVHGFSEVRSCAYGTTPRPGGLVGVDGHHIAVGHEMARLETSILEAVK